MKNVKSIWLLSLTLLVGNGISAQTLFENYKKERKQAKETLLPDFSFAGYECGEKAIPSPDYKVFNVCDFGSIADDEKSDKEAIQAAIDAATLNGSGIVYFPKGIYRINEPSDKGVLITVKGNNIILRGEPGAVLFMQENNDARNPEQMWTTPYHIQFRSKGKRLSGSKMEIVREVNVHETQLELSEVKGLSAGDWIMIEMVCNDPQRVAEELKPYSTSPEWTEINDKGVTVRVFHQIKHIRENILTLRQPIAYKMRLSEPWTVQKANLATGNGIENLTFRGNWKEKFVHHKSALHDSGWSLISFAEQANGWIRNCVFEDVNAAARVSLSANVSVLDCKVIGNMGHNSISTEGSTNVLIGRCIDTAGQWHAFGTSKPSMNTVIWRCSYPETTCFESHASQPRNTLFDVVVGGWHYNHEGGAVHALPSHLQNLVFWNYTRLNEKINKVEGTPMGQKTPFVFWDTTQAWWKNLPPVIAGFKGPNVVFELSQLKAYEAIGGTTKPESLYEAQLKLRGVSKIEF